MLLVIVILVLLHSNTKIPNNGNITIPCDRAKNMLQDTFFFLRYCTALFLQRVSCNFFQLANHIPDYFSSLGEPAFIFSEHIAQ